MTRAKKSLAILLSLLSLSAVCPSVFAAPEFVISDISYEETFAGCPYDFQEPNQQEEWKNLGQSVFLDGGEGVMCIGFDETSNIGTQMGVYIKLLENFTQEDLGTYKISYRTMLNMDLFSDFALSPNEYRGNSVMGGRMQRDAGVWNTVSGELTISQSNAAQFMDKPLYLFLYYAQNMYVSEKFTDVNFKAFIDDVCVTKEADPSVLNQGTYMLTADVLAKTPDTSGSFYLTAAEFASTGGQITQEQLGDFDYSGKTQLRMAFGVDHDMLGGYFRIFAADSDGKMLSEGARMPKFYKNGVDLLPNASFAYGLDGWNVENGEGSIDTQRYYDGSPSLGIVSDGTQASVSSADIYELIKEYGAGSYLVECNIYSEDAVKLNASFAGKASSETAEGGGWIYTAVLIEITDADIAAAGAAALTLTFTSEKPIKLNVDNIGLRKVLE